MAYAELKAAIDRFLADNPELEALAAELAQFNVFRAMRIERAEIRHSNTLAWLMDPRGSHGLGSIFLRRLLSNMLLVNDADIAGLSAADVELMDLSDVEVRREWRNMDILVLIRARPNVAVLVENKLDSGEAVGQLARYRKAVSEEFADFGLIPVLLTLDGQASDDDSSEFIPYSHSNVLDVLTRIVTQRRSQMPQAVEVFLEQYLATLRRLTMRDEKLVELCKTIYRKHREAIDTIVELAGSNEFDRIANEVFDEDGSFEILGRGRNVVRLIPRSWSPILPANGTAWNGLSRPLSVCCELYHNVTRNLVRLTALVSSMDDPKLRLACVKALRTAGFKLTDDAMRVEARYSRFYSRKVSLAEGDDADQVRRAVESLLAQAKQHLPGADAVFREVFKGKASGAGRG